MRERIGTPSPPELLPSASLRCRRGRCPDDVPERISLFGLSTIPGGAPLIEQLDALGTQREILLFLHQPSLALAGRVSAAAQSEAPTASAPHLRADDRSSSLVANPLLASWGRPAREAVVLLGDRCTQATSIPAPGAGSTPTLLARLQHDLRSDTAPEGTFELRDDDRSITLHSCYGDTRQVEVLRDQILHLLVDDPTLDEDDIVVLCPALGSFAPIIESVLGPPGDPAERIDDPGEALDHDGPRPVAPSLRYRLSDRSLGSTYPLLGALGALVELLASRFSDRAVLEFASLDPVSRRHGFDDDALSTIAGWIATANTRWGIDGRHRERWGIPAGHETGSWRRRVDRLLMGIAIETHGLTLAPGDLPPIGVEGSDTVVAGHLAGLLEHLARLAARAEESMPVHRWIELLRRASDDLFCADPDNPWESRRLSGVLARIEDAATVIDGGPHAEGAVGCRPARVDLTLDDIRHLIGAELGTSSGRSDFFRGGITFCTPTPLGAVPHRVVCLLGMDDSAFSAGAIDGDDLVTAEPHLGDRDRRADSRHVLLDCILAAREHLVVLRNGHNVVTNQEIPATVAVAELTDALRATVRRTGHDPVTDRLTVEHPGNASTNQLPHRLTPGSATPVPPSAQLGLERPWASTRRTARVRPPATTRARHRGSWSTPWHRFDPIRSRSSDLQEFLTHPPRYFLRRVLELSIPHPPKRDDASAGTQPAGSSGLPMAAPGRNLLVGLDSLEAWGSARTC
ncbi:MAG: exodeoxyribonuclease V subunit gamma [Microthrixaceae bacterium]|nr:exodeoxyribonuclease V subunit gamma [Microthrixaceae bacterium]